MAENTQSDRSVRQYVVLVADEDPDLRDYIAKCLTEDSTRIGSVVQAASGTEAVETFRSMRIDLVIADSRLSGLSGVELCRWVVGTDTNPVVPTILITEDDLERDALALGETAGAAAVIRKPFNADTVCRTVRSVLGRRERP